MLVPFFGDRYFWSTSGAATDDLNTLLEGVTASAIVVIADAAVPATVLDLDSLTRSVRLVDRVVAGESRKCLSAVGDFADRYAAHLDPDAVVVAVGGGSLLDYVGLCCGLLYRGVRYVSVPTSVIAMSDAAYGGKTAVNGRSKNQMGMYHHPHAVYANPHLLASLPLAHVRSGLIEVAKLALFFSDLAAQIAAVEAIDPISDLLTLSAAMRLAATRKLELLAGDPKERHEGSILLYGHAFGNAFEAHTWSHHGQYMPHGVAVALGISFSDWLAEAAGHISHKERERRTRLIDRFVAVPAALEAFPPPSRRELAECLRLDKYVAAERLRVPALEAGAPYTELSLDDVTTVYDAWREDLSPFSTGDGTHGIDVGR